MAVIGREAARAPLTSADINDGIVGAADLQSTLDLSSKTITLGTVTADAVTVSPSSGAATLTLSSNASQPWEVYSPDASNDLRFKSDSTDYVTINTTGLVGVGTTTINEKLVLGSADSGSTFLQITNSTTTSADNRGFYVGIDSNEAARILNRENTDLVFSTNNTTQMTLDTSGNLGIGTTSPSESLETTGNIQIKYAGSNSDPSGARYLYFNNTDTTLVAGQPLGGLSWVNNDASATAGEAAYVKAYATTNTGRAELRFGTGDQNAPAEAMRIDANGNVGIGTSSPAGITSGITTLAISDAGAKTTGDKTGALSFITNDGSFTGTYSDGVTAEISSISTSSTGASYALAFSTATTTGSDRAERMRIDHSGHVLTGTTTRHATSSTFSGLTVFPTGVSIQKRSSGLVGYYDRLTDDGAIHQFQRGGTAVGSIGGKDGDLYIGTGVCGMRFLDADPSISALNLNTQGLNDNAVDLGRANDRWKDLYLGGGLYVGGTAAANKFDDYEEGTFTASLTGSTSSPATKVTATGNYRKIGAVVHFNVGFENISTTGYSGPILISGLPFSQISGSRSLVNIALYNDGVWNSGDHLVGIVPSTDDYVQFRRVVAGGAWQALEFKSTGSSRYFWASGTYTTTS